jgi:hypothetical protein
MTRSVPAVPGVPAAGHVVLGSGAWHPGGAEVCGKPACQQRDKSTSRQSDEPTEHERGGRGCCQGARPTSPLNHNLRVRRYGRCTDPCHRQPRRT